MSALVFISIKHVSVTFFLSESPLNTDTRIIRTLWHVPLVSVLAGSTVFLNVFLNRRCDLEECLARKKLELEVKNYANQSEIIL